MHTKDYVTNVFFRKLATGIGGSYDQAYAEWIVIRTQLRGRNDMPFGRILYVLVTIN